jgi:D-arabinose 1-dehydrogenase-like Zn-dependent alcohol dehydrogenase
MINAVDDAAKHSFSRLQRFEVQREDGGDAYDKIEKGDVRFRYVIDMASLKTGVEG